MTLLDGTGKVWNDSGKLKLKKNSHRILCSVSSSFYFRVSNYFKIMYLMQVCQSAGLRGLITPSPPLPSTKGGCSILEKRVGVGSEIGF